MSTRVDPSRFFESKDMASRVTPPGATILWLGGTCLLWTLYTFVFVAASGQTIGDAMLTAVANVMPLSLLAAATRAILKSYLMLLGVRVQMLLHPLLAVAFATTWYATVIVLLAFCRGLRGGTFAVEGFSGPGFVWQVFQGLVLYALVAAICYAIRGGREAATIQFVTSPEPLERYLTRDGEEMRPVEVKEIVSITGAQDYSEVATLRGRHLVRMGLGEFESRLDRASFLRVHRSTIINFHHLERVEPAGGGRMTAHMANGDSIDVSRTGAQKLRSFVV
ncbi:MAG: hypothetical protein B7Y45_04865 [Sphingomonas sp. 28-66-16]|nr:MAG: hypothetical protein B7Y45_04865 [Sphingomonas sp. 28-66-16]